jgi:phosphohistidine swiveling domain-containing protein
MPLVLPFAAVPPDSVALVGGKGLSLALAARAGLPVPPGFVVTTDAFQNPAATAAIAEAYRQFGGGPVAVRSSATAEDGAETSFAGQQETVLGVVGEADVLAAVERCWRSLFTERAVAYRREQGIADDAAKMAVVVQQLVPAEAAGVLFTRGDPEDLTVDWMSVEAAWGLGEVVVSGRVTPDHYTLELLTGEVLEKTAGQKTVEITPAGVRPVSEERQAAFCLTDTQLSQLADLGRRVEQFSGGPRDVEWAIAGGRVHLLQARPITAGNEREAVRREVIAATAALGGTAWVRYNLSESLPEPTPMTWAVVRRMLAADGGFGALNRDLGCDPDPTLGPDGAFDLIAGRPMANLARMPRLQFRRPPVEYPIAEYKADPAKALDPKPALAPHRIGLLRLPAVMWRLSRIGRTTRKLADTFAERYSRDIAPPFVAAAKAALAQDWSKLDPPQLVAEFRHWVDRTFVEFARDALKPTALAAFLWDQLGDAAASAARGAKTPEEKSLTAGVSALAVGTLSRVEFLNRFGHRCGNELELSQPRWGEEPTSVDALTARSLSPLSEDAAPVAGIMAERLRTYLGLREVAKHDLLRGVAVVRRALVELDARFRLNGGVFFLTPDVLPALIAGRDFAPTIAGRRKRRRLELSLELPAVLFADDLEAIGRPLPPPTNATTLTGVAVSAGVAEAPALVLTQPTDPPTDPFVLVCPSTDPGWVPLFARAKAVVMETGGVLSHGAIVAREFGLPAVTGVADVVRRITTGMRVRVDGTAGTVSILD